jgi:hypothetical protein
MLNALQEKRDLIITFFVEWKKLFIFSMIKKKLKCTLFTKRMVIGGKIDLEYFQGF